MELRSLLAVCMTLFLLTSARECKEKSSQRDFSSERIFNAVYNAPSALDIHGSRASVSEALGNCTSPEEHAGKMIDYFGSYGVNLTHVRQDPYVSYDENGFNLRLSNSRNTDFRIYYGTYLGHSRFINTRASWTDWTLIAKKTYTGPSGNLPAGYIIFYGMDRFKLDGRYYCIEYYSRTPVDASTLSRAAPVDEVVYNEYWGKGYAHGMLNFGPNKTTGPITFHFPGTS